jgi:O-acetyl-ADP-ribose deacetylase (regulator of RNase III)
MVTRSSDKPIEGRRLVQRWTNRSVLAFTKGSDPIQMIIAEVRKLLFRAFESGWSGPPYNPFALAELRGIEVSPSKDVVDAQIIPLAGGRFRIEFNPDRSTGRMNYSVAHELGHSLFPDCAELVRNRTKHSGATPDEWQLEMLCNMAAAEILMPIGSLHRDDLNPSIDRLIEVRSRYAVSSEAVLLRIIRLTASRCFGFVARREPDSPTGKYKVDYAVTSPNWNATVGSGFVLPQNSVVSQCTAIGFTAKSTEKWAEVHGDWKVEALGVPPYPGRSYPRVIGIVKPSDEAGTTTRDITYLRGDATVPRGSGLRILAQLVNDRAIIWGAGFGRAVRRKWPDVQARFAEWAVSHRAEFRLGNTHFSRVDDSLLIAQMIAQHGVGPSRTPRIRYAALETCLQQLADQAELAGAGVHMPRIGTGEAGGSWDIVSEIVEETLCEKGIDVTVYDLPSSPKKGVIRQRSLSFS